MVSTPAGSGETWLIYGSLYYYVPSFASPNGKPCCSRSASGALYTYTFRYAPTIGRFLDASPEMCSEKRHLDFTSHPPRPTATPSPLRGRCRPLDSRGDIREAIQRVRFYTAGMDYKAFAADTNAPRRGAGIKRANSRDRGALFGSRCT